MQIDKLTSFSSCDRIKDIRFCVFHDLACTYDHETTIVIVYEYLQKGASAPAPTMDGHEYAWMRACNDLMAPAGQSTCFS